MKTRNRHSLFALVVLAATLWSTHVHAQEVRVSASVNPSSVAVGQTFTYEVSASTQGNDAISLEERPLFPNSLRLIGTTRAPSFMLRNGRAQRSLTTTFRLQATRAGRFDIASAKVRVGQRTIQTDRVRVEVLPAGQAPALPKPRRQLGSSPDQIDVEHVITPQREIYVGEQITLRYNLLAATTGPSHAPQPPDEPDLDAFWIEDLSDQVAGRRETVRAANRFMRRVGLRAYALFPLEPGETTIEPLTVNVETGGFFTNRRSQQIASEPVPLTILPLPPGAPESFEQGHVGQWQFRVTTDRLSAAVGEPVRIRVRVEGDGLISRIQLPTLPEVAGARVAGSDEDVQRSTEDMRVSGSRQLDYTLVPTEEGQLEIPSLSFSFFDPQAKAYRTLRSEPLQISVAPGKQALPPQPVIPPKDDAAGTARTLDHTARLPAMNWPGVLPEVDREAERPLTSTPLFWLFIATPLLGLLLIKLEPLLASWRRSRRPRTNKRRATSRAQHIAGQVAQQPSSEGASQLHEALHLYWTQGLGIADADITTGRIAERIELITDSKELGARAKQLLERIDGLRYAPQHDADGSSLVDLAREVRALLDALERARPSGSSSLILHVFVGAIFTAGWLGPAPAAASEPDNLLTQIPPQFHSVKRAEIAQQWTDAAAQWKVFADQYPDNAAVHLNLGIAHFQADNLGAARLAFERAALLDPHHDQIRAHLRIAERVVTDRRIDAMAGGMLGSTDEHGLAIWRLATQTRVDALALAGALFLWIALVFSALGRIRRDAGTRWERWATRAALAVATLCAVSILVRQAALEATTPVVVTAETEAPRQGPSRFAGHHPSGATVVEGVVLAALDVRDGWVQLDLGAGQSAWLPLTEVEFIDRDKNPESSSSPREVAATP